MCIILDLEQYGGVEHMICLDALMIFAKSATLVLTKKNCLIALDQL